MEKDLISRADALAALSGVVARTGLYGTSIEIILETLPPVEAEYVVHCENCTRGDPTDSTRGRVWCTKMCRYMKLDGYCSFGDRKDIV